MGRLTDKYCVVGAGETSYSKNSGKTTRGMGAEAVCNATLDASPTAADVNGMLNYHGGDSTPAPEIADDLGIQLDFYMDCSGGGSSTEQGQLVVKKCASCDLLRYPPGSGCPWCMSLDWSWQAVSGKGTIYTYEVIVYAIQAGFREIAPYPVVVELDEQRGVPSEHEGLRLVANLVDAQFNPEAEANVAIGKRVEVVFQTINEDFSLPQFKLSNEPPEGPVWQFPS